MRTLRPSLPSLLHTCLASLALFSLSALASAPRVLSKPRQSNTYLIIPQRLLTLPVKLQKALQFRLFIRMPFVLAQDIVEQLCDGVGDGEEEVHHAEHKGGAGASYL